MIRRLLLDALRDMRVKKPYIFSLHYPMSLTLLARSGQPASSPTRPRYRRFCTSTTRRSTSSSRDWRTLSNANQRKRSRSTACKTSAKPSRRLGRMAAEDTRAGHQLPGDFRIIEASGGLNVIAPNVYEVNFRIEAAEGYGDI